MHDESSIFAGENVVGFFERRHAESELSPREKAQRRAERARVQRGLDKRADWTPEMHEEEQARIRAEIEEWERTRDAA